MDGGNRPMAADRCKLGERRTGASFLPFAEKRERSQPRTLFTLQYFFYTPRGVASGGVTFCKYPWFAVTFMCYLHAAHAHDCRHSKRNAVKRRNPIKPSSPEFVAHSFSIVRRCRPESRYPLPVHSRMPRPQAAARTSRPPYHL